MSWSVLESGVEHKHLAVRPSGSWCRVHILNKVNLDGVDLETFT